MLMTLIVWIVFIPLKQKTSKLESHKKGWGKRYFCDVVMSSSDTKILEFNQYRKSDKTSPIIYSDFEYLITRIDGCKNNSGKSSKTKVGEHNQLWKDKNDTINNRTAWVVWKDKNLLHSFQT